MEQKLPSMPVLLVFFLCSNLVTILSIVIGLISQFFYWLIFDSFGRRHRRRTQKKFRNDNENKTDDEYYAIIIGTGFSGLGMAIKLNQLGARNYVLLERNGHVGGTWYANGYPGCACDVPSNLYSYSFEPNPNWSHYFSRQGEIAQYLERCAVKYDIVQHIHFHTTVTELRWLEDRQLWQVKTQSNEQEKQWYARIVIAGSGPLSTAAFPKDIADIDQFKGEMFHTAQWKKNLDFNNKRVAVVGTGASAIQVVPAVQKMGVSKLYVFQRTPPWLIPRIDRCVSEFEKQLFTWFPLLQKLTRRCIYWGREVYVLSFAYRWPLRYVNEELVKHNLRTQVKDKQLITKVTPKWDLGCKRVLVTSDWYSALQQSNVELITERIQKVTSDSMITTNNDEYHVDIIIWSTGFETQQFSIPTFGIAGCSLEKQWSETMQAYRGVTVPNYPNLFLLLGPNSRLGHSSVIIMLEAQLKYIVEALLFMDKHRVKTMTIKPRVHEEYNRTVQEKLKKTVWYLGGCRSWYQDAKGNVTTLWPDFTWKYHQLMITFDSENYILEQ